MSNFWDGLKPGEAKMLVEHHRQANQAAADRAPETAPEDYPGGITFDDWDAATEREQEEADQRAAQAEQEHFEEYLESFEREPQTFTLGELMDHWENDHIEEWGYEGPENPPADTVLRFEVLDVNDYVIEYQDEAGDCHTFLTDFIPEELRPEWIGG